MLIGVRYIPKQSSKYFSDGDLCALEEETMSACSSFDYVYLLGAYNAQTADTKYYTIIDASLDKYLELDQDTIEFFDQESFLFINNHILVNRSSKDTKKTNIGYRIIDICKNNNTFNLNGKYSNDKGVGNYTFRVQSVIDYAITSPEGYSLLSNFEIQDLDRIYSDRHSLLKVVLKSEEKSYSVLFTGSNNMS